MLHLGALPDELLLHIMVECTTTALGRTRCCSAQLRALGKNATLWATRYTTTRPFQRCGGPIGAIADSFARAVHAHRCCADCKRAASAPVGFPSGRHAHLVGVRASIESTWRLTPSQVSKLDEVFCRRQGQSAADACSAIDALVHCAVWPTKHGPRYWVCESSDFDDPPAMAAAARACVRGDHDVVGWQLLPTEAGDEPSGGANKPPRGAHASARHGASDVSGDEAALEGSTHASARNGASEAAPDESMLSLEVSEWRRLERWLQSERVAGAVAEALPPSVRGAQVIALDCP